ncbi:MAG: hypothetical protein BWY92_01093 [Firmicutes bacterium ADurb.BinA052]|nr:MAG: hypothetical protein BWY92_01093 [Firmicutes bacterium ADurb.BinA052]
MGPPTEHTAISVATMIYRDMDAKRLLMVLPP